ncbi:MAG: hypothetical protein WA051_01670 [Minisyncoccia bacterium]
MEFHTAEQFVARMRAAGIRSVALVGNIDLVILGPCSENSWHFFQGDPITEQAPFGRYWGTVFQDEVKRREAKKVLLISGCCGSYEPKHQAVIRRSVPGVEVLIPDVPDFCDFLFSPNPGDQVVRLMRRLVTDGIAMEE